MSGTLTSDTASLAALVNHSQFIDSCYFVENYVATNTPPAPTILQVTNVTLLDVADCTTAKEMPIEKAIRQVVDTATVSPAAGNQGYLPTELYVQTTLAHDNGQTLEYFFSMYNNYVMTQQGTITLNGVSVMPGDTSSNAGVMEALYLRIKFFKYNIYGETNDTARTLYQRINTFLLLCMLAQNCPFGSAGTAAYTINTATMPPSVTYVADSTTQATATKFPLTAEASPLADLIKLCNYAASENTNNNTLNSIAALNVDDAAQTSSSLIAEIRQAQSQIQRASNNISQARNLKTDQLVQLVGWIMLLTVAVVSFYGMYFYRRSTWNKYKYIMSVAASFVALHILGLTIWSIVQQRRESFCQANGTCVPDMMNWADQASQMTYLTVADGTSRYAKDLLNSRNSSMSEDLSALTQKVNSMDIDYQSHMFDFNRLRQSKRFVIMSLVIALLLMTIVVMGWPMNMVITLHVLFAIVILATGYLVFRGNAQRMRKNFNKIYYPSPPVGTIPASTGTCT